MATMIDIQIKAWINKDERFEQRGDSGGLFLSYRENFAYPVWKFRYRIAELRRVMTLGSYKDLSLADARKLALRLVMTLPPRIEITYTNTMGRKQV